MHGWCRYIYTRLQSAKYHVDIDPFPERTPTQHDLVGRQVARLGPSPKFADAGASRERKIFCSSLRLPNSQDI